jgi:ABC-type transport system involved in multi-copper enzyme maturation permease subunit
MKSLFITTATIAKNTFRETIRDRILMSVWLVIIAIILFSLFVGTLSHDHNTRIITNFGVTAIYLLQVFIALFIGSMLMYKELERKTFYLIIPKPVSRVAIIIGKCLGLTLTTLLVTVLSSLFLTIVLILSGGATFVPLIFVSMVLSTLEAILLILVSLLFSSFTSPIIAFVSSIAVYLIGHGGSIYRFIYTTTEIPIVATITKAIYHLVPNLEKFNIRNDIVYGVAPSLGMVGFSIVYAFLYASLLLYITVTIFKKKDF